jgi:hypothetical protein
MPPHNLDSVASISIHLHAGGAMSISGNIGDKALALKMLDHARDAVNAQIKDRSEIVVPNRDVVVAQHPAFPTRPLGDMRPEDRGDP